MAHLNSESNRTMPTRQYLLLVLIILADYQFITVKSVPAPAGISSPYSYSPRINQFVARQVPRFKIPRGGNLAFYSQPYWELLYYDKFGVFPHFSIPSTSTLTTPAVESSVNPMRYVKYINKIRKIQSFMEKNNGDMNNSEESSLENNNNTNNDKSPPEENTIQEPSEYGDLGTTKINGKVKRVIEGSDGGSKSSFMVDTDPTWFTRKIPKSVKVGLLLNKIQDKFPADGSGIEQQDDGTLLNLRSTTVNGERNLDRKFQTQGWK